MSKNVFISVAVVVCLIAAWIYTETKGARAVRPPQGVTNLVAFLDLQHPKPSKIRRFVQNGKVHLEVIGERFSSPLSLPSGPPAYIFDDTGALVDWTGDRGDAPSFVSKWGSLSNAVFISVEEAKQAVNTPNR